MWKIIFWALLSGAVLITSCASDPAQLGPDITPEELVQRGQEATDRNRYNLALRYYNEILERFPSYIDMICAAEYEIAHVHYKQKKYAIAKTELNALLARYNGSDEELLPPQFKRLCSIVLEQIEEKERKQEQIRRFFRIPSAKPQTDQ